jgi:hypothetical protein
VTVLVRRALRIACAAERPRCAARMLDTSTASRPMSIHSVSLYVAQPSGSFRACTTASTIARPTFATTAGSAPIATVQSAIVAITQGAARHATRSSQKLFSIAFPSSPSA